MVSLVHRPNSKLQPAPLPHEIPSVDGVCAGVVMVELGR